MARIGPAAVALELCCPAGGLSASPNPRLEIRVEGRRIAATVARECPRRARARDDPDTELYPRKIRIGFHSFGPARPSSRKSPLSEPSSTVAPGMVVRRT